MDRRRAAGLLLALAACFATATAAPTASNHTSIDLYDGAPEGCYYNFQRYGEGDRIMTNEPCLNCTCHNRMLMCYLRVCPFTKPIGQDCTIEKRADQCCPIVTCPDVPVDLLTSTTTSPAEYGSTGMGKLDKFGCSIDGKYFPEGSKVPPTPNKPCEHCYCIRNMTTCVMQECTLHVDGCTPIYHKDVCCPVRYSCDHPEDEMPLLDDLSTTVRPTPGFLLTTTTISPVTQISQDCVYDSKVFPDGALIKTEKACDHCYCMKGDIVCVVQECGTPMENEGKNCTALSPREGVCCPDTYICEGDEPTTGTYENDITTQETTTLIPPRRTSSEGSGYRNEPDEVPYTKFPVQEPEVEGSGEEEELKSTEISPISSPEIIDDLATTEDTHEYIPLTTSKPTVEVIPAVDVTDDESMVTSAEIDTNSDPSQNLPSTTVAPQLVSEGFETITEKDLSQDVGSGEAPDDDINVTQITTTIVPKIEETEGMTNLNKQDLVTPGATKPETSEYGLPTTSVPIEESDITNEPMKELTSSDENEATTSKILIENATPLIPASDEIITIGTEYPEKAVVTSKPDETIAKETITPQHYLPSSKAPTLDDDFVTTESQEHELVTETAISTEYLEPQPHITASTPMLEEIEKDTTEFIEPEHIIPIDATQDNQFDTTSTSSSSTEKADKEFKETTIGGVDINKEHKYTTTNIPVFDQQEIFTVEPNALDSVEPEQYSTTTRNAALDESGRRTTPDLTVTMSKDGEMPHEFSASTTSPASEFEATTEPDKGLNTIPSDIVEEVPMSPEIQITTSPEENIPTESDLTNSFESDISDTRPSTISSGISVSSEEPSTFTTESAFRKEDSSSIDSQEKLEITITPATATEKIITTSVHGIKSTESTMDLLHTMDTTVQPMHTENIEEVTLPKEDTNVPNYESSTSKIPTSDKEYAPGEEIITDAPQHEKIPETTSANQDDNEIFNEPRIPGEGDCLVNGVTYTNESAVPSTNKCQSGCKCVSSIVKCDPIICSPPPEYMNNCEPMYDSPEACCPTYICDHKTETIPPQSHSQMSGTEAPVILPVQCDGDGCEISKDKEVPVVQCESGSCTETSNDSEIADLQPTQSFPEQPVSDQKPCVGDKCKKTEVISQENQIPCVNSEDCSSIDIPTKECSTGNCDQIESGSEKECKEGSCKKVESSSLDKEVPEQCSEPGCKQTQIDSETESTPSMLQPTSQEVDNKEAPVNSNDVFVTEKSETVPHDVLTTLPVDNEPTFKFETGLENTTKPVKSIDQAEEDKITTESSSAPSREYTSETQEANRPTETYEPIDVTKVAPEEYSTDETITSMSHAGTSSDIEADTSKPEYATSEAPKVNEGVEHVETTIKSFQDSTTEPSKLHTNEPQETTETTEGYNKEDITKKIVEEYVTESTPSSDDLTKQPNLQESSETSKPISTESEGVTKSPIEPDDMGIPSAVTEASDVILSSDNTKSPKIVTTDNILEEDYTESSVAADTHKITQSPPDQEISTKYYTDLSSKTTTAESNKEQTSNIIVEPVTEHYEVTKSEDVDSKYTTIKISEETSSEPTKIVEKGPEVASPEDVTSKILTTSATDLPIFSTNAYDETKSSEDPIGTTFKDVNQMPTEISILESDTDSNKQIEKDTETDKPTIVEIVTKGPENEDKLITESGSGVSTTLSSTDSKVTEPETASTSPYYSESHSSSHNDEQTQITLSSTESNLLETTQAPMITDNEIPDHTQIDKNVPEVSTNEFQTTLSEIGDITTLKPIVTQDEKTKTEHPGESSPQNEYHTQNILEVVTEETSIITELPTTVSEVEKIPKLPAEKDSTKEKEFELATTEMSSEGKPIHDKTYTIQPIHTYNSSEPTLADDITNVYPSEDMSTIEPHDSKKSEKPQDDLAQSLVTGLYDATTKPSDLDFHTSTSILVTTPQPIESVTTMAPDKEKSSEKTTTLQNEPYTTVGKHDEKSDVVTPKYTLKPINEEIQTQSTIDMVTFKEHTQEMQITERTEPPKSTESPGIPSGTEAPLPKPLPEDDSSLSSKETTTELSEIESELTTRTPFEKTKTPIALEPTTPKGVISESTADIANTDKSANTPIEEHTTIENVRATESSDNVPLSPELNKEEQPEKTETSEKDTFDDKYLTTEKLKESEVLQTTQPTVEDIVEKSTHSSVLPEEGSMTADGRRTTSVLDISPSVEITTSKGESLIPAIDVMDIEKTSEAYESVPVQTERVIPASEKPILETTAPEEEFIVATSKATTAMPDVEISTKSVTEELTQPIPTVFSESITSETPEITVSEVPEASVTKLYDEPVTSPPEYAITTESESVITFAPEESITTLPESLITASQVPIKPITDDTTTTESETFVIPLATAELPEKPNETEIGLPAINIPEEHATKMPTTTVSEFSLATDSDVPEAFITNEPKEPATASPEISISSAPDVPSMTASEKTTTGASESPEVPITSLYEATITSVSEVTTTLRPMIPTSPAEETLVPSIPETHTTSVPEVLTSIANKVPDISEDEGSVPSIPESDTTSAPEVLATSASEVPATSQDEVPVPTTPESYATSAPEVLATSAPEVPATSKVEVTVSPIPESHATSAPEVLATSGPKVPDTTQDEVSVPTTPESAATPESQALATSAPKLPATSQDEVSVLTTPKSYVATAPEILATSAPEVPTTSQDEVQSYATTAPEVPATSQDEVLVSTTPKSLATAIPEVLATSASEVPASAQDEVTAPPTPESDATLVPEVLVTSATEVPTTSQDEEPVPTTPKPYTTTAPEVLATSVPEEPATAQNEKTVPPTHESDATLAPEVLVTSAPEVPVTSQDEVPVSTTPKSYVPTATPEALSTSGPKVPSTSADVVPEPHATEKPVTSAPEIPATSADDAMISLAPESHATLAPEIPATLADEVLATSAPKEPLTTAPETPTTSAPEELASSTPEILVTSASEAPVVTASEIPFTKAPEAPIVQEGSSTSAPELPKPTFTESHPMEELPTEEDGSFPTGGTSGYGQEPDYVEEDQTFGPGTCRYGGKVYVSAQQIPRDDPCDFCFCFRSDIICLQQSCPPPIHGCHEEPIQGFCCPRYECPVSMATTVNVTTTTTTTTTTLPPHFPTHPYKGSAQRRGCQIKGQTYKVGEVVRASSGPCLQCTCGGDGQMKCDPRSCTPEPMLRQMIAAAVSAKRRR